MATRTPYDTALESVMALDGSDQRRLLQDLLKHLLGRTPRKGAAKGGAAGGAGGGGSWWTAATKRASSVVAPLRDAENVKLSAAGKKKLPGTVAVIVLAKLKEEGKVTKEGAFPSDEEIQTAFAAYMDTYEPEDAKSTASKGSKATGGSKTSGPKFKDLSPEEQKARRSEAAKKAAAQRKANKAAAAALASGDDEPLGAAPALAGGALAGSSNAVGGGGPAAAAAAAEPTFQKRKIGKKEYLVMEIGPLTHVCDLEENWLGVLKGTKIVKEGYSSPFEGDD